MSLTPAELHALRLKYESLVALKEAREKLESAGHRSFGEAERQIRRAAMRELAAAFPGALRELDSASLEDLRGRLQELGAASNGGPIVPWMEATSLFHTQLRGRLKTRAGQRSSVLTMTAVWKAVAAELEITPDAVELLVYPTQRRY